MSARPAPTSGPLRNVYSVTRLNQEAKDLLEDTFPLLWVEGELSNLARPASGHWYFSLKDAAAQVRCAMFRGANRQVRFSPGNGTQVLVRGRVSLYAPRGDFQLIVEHMEEAGLGALLRAFEALKQRLAAEGLFDQERKRPLPALPRRIGVVTSPSGAAIRDVLSVLRRRFPAIPVLLYPTAVQGGEAPQAIAGALASACARKDCDVLLVTRGGGSLEDLWAFNDERVARAIAACDIPVVSAVGHEVDFTIADFVADRRAPTPSAAAELLSPDQTALRRDLEQHLQRLAAAARGRCAATRQRLAGLQARLAHQHPERRLQAHAQRLDELDRRLTRAMARGLQSRRGRLAELGARLRHHLPLHRLGQLQARRERLHLRLVTAVRRTLEDRERRLAGAARALGAVSPLATLERGYAIVTRPDSGEVIRRTEQVQAGETVRARLGRGALRCRVEGVEDGPWKQRADG